MKSKLIRYKMNTTELNPTNQTSQKPTQQQQTTTQTYTRRNDTTHSTILNTTHTIRRVPPWNCPLTSSGGLNLVYGMPTSHFSPEVTINKVIPGNPSDSMVVSGQTRDQDGVAAIPTEAETDKDQVTTFRSTDFGRDYHRVLYCFGRRVIQTDECKNRIYFKRV